MAPSAIEKRKQCTKPFLDSSFITDGLSRPYICAVHSKNTPTMAQLSKDDFTHKYLSFHRATIHLLDDVVVCSENPKYYVGHIFPVIPFHEFICFEAFNCAIVNWFMKE